MTLREAITRRVDDKTDIPVTKRTLENVGTLGRVSTGRTVRYVVIQVVTLTTATASARIRDDRDTIVTGQKINSAHKELSGRRHTSAGRTRQLQLSIRPMQEDSFDHGTS